MVPVSGKIIAIRLSLYPFFFSFSAAGAYTYVRTLVAMLQSNVRTYMHPDAKTPQTNFLFHSFLLFLAAAIAAISFLDDDDNSSPDARV